MNETDHRHPSTEGGTSPYPPSKDAVSGSQRLTDLAYIYAKVGEREKAIALLEKLLSIPSFINIPILQHDPFWDPLRGHPG
ncbi:MAG: hypothetical protein ACREA0_12060, partial [bacterium]